MKPTIFYSWQSDIEPGAACRYFIQQALDAAADEIRSDEGIGVEPVVDRDTQNVPGCPDIGATILSKIDAAAAFVADVTLVGKTCIGKPTPNPNVLVEFGYALKSLGWDRIILVQNAAFGGPELLPFDLRQKRAMVYTSPADAAERATARRALQRDLKGALTRILQARASAQQRRDVAVTLDHVRLPNSTGDVHHYELVAVLRNVGTKRFDDWDLEVEFPTPLLEPTIIGIKVDDRSDSKRTLFRASQQRSKRSVHPGDQVTVRIGYRITREIYYERRHELYPELANVRAYVDGELAGEVQRTVEQLQNY